MRTAIIDADVLCFYSSAVAEDSPEVDWGDGVMTGDKLEHAIRLAEEKLEEWLGIAQCKDFRLVFSGDRAENWRRAIHPEYKRKRTAEKPSSYEPLRKYFEDNYLSYSFRNLEGDDVCGLFVTCPPKLRYGVMRCTETDDLVVVSTDKDIYTLPGELVRIAHSNKPQEAPLYNIQYNADLFWMTQVLTGDPVDEYRGCPGVGPKRAELVLKDSRDIIDMMGRVKEEYRRQSNHPRWGNKFIDSWRNEYLMNMRAARILRWGDYDFKTEEVTFDGLRQR
jgi:DNA polymerase-1